MKNRTHTRLSHYGHLTINPFVSKAQRRACYAADDPAWDCDEWEEKTPEGLPERKKGKTGVRNSAAPSSYDPSRTLPLYREIASELDRGVSQFVQYLRAMLSDLAPTDNSDDSVVSVMLDNYAIMDWDTRNRLLSTVLNKSYKSGQRYQEYKSRKVGASGQPNCGTGKGGFQPGNTCGKKGNQRESGTVIDTVKVKGVEALDETIKFISEEATPGMISSKINSLSTLMDTLHLTSGHEASVAVAIAAIQLGPGAAKRLKQGAAWIVKKLGVTKNVESDMFDPKDPETAEIIAEFLQQYDDETQDVAIGLLAIAAQHEPDLDEALELVAEALEQTGDEEGDDVENKDYDFACVKLDITDPAILSVLTSLRASLDPADVIELEETPHITVLFGLHDNPDLAEQVKALVGGYGPVTGTLGGLSVFRLPDKDVLKFDILEDRQFQELNKLLKTLPYTNEYDYSPHLTVAYLQPGTGDKYIQESVLTGLPISEEYLTFSDKGGYSNKIVVNLLYNAFCPTGRGGGKDPTCSPHSSSGTTAKLEALGRLEKFKSITPDPNDPSSPRQSVLSRGGEFIKPPFRADYSEEAGVKMAEIRSHPNSKREISEVPLDKVVVRQNAVSRASVKYMIEAGERTEQSYELPVMVKMGNDYYLYDGTHRASADKIAGRESIKAVVYSVPDRPTPAPAKKGTPKKAKKVRNVESVESLSKMAVRQRTEEFKRRVENSLRSAFLSQDRWGGFLGRAFSQGAGRAYNDAQRVLAKPRSVLRSKNRREAELYLEDAFTQSLLGRPEMRKTLDKLSRESYRYVEKLIDDVTKKMSIALRTGLTDGASKSSIQAALTEIVRKAQRHAELIAQTEIVRAHSTAQLRTFEALGIGTVGISVEYSTSKDRKVCGECASLRGKLYKTSEAYGLIPKHPRCRCTFVPVPTVTNEEETLTPTPDPLTDLYELSEIVVTDNRSFFADCQRDKGGRCLPREGGQQADDPEFRRAQKIARDKAKRVVEPTVEEVRENREGMAALGANLYRRNLVGNSADRRRRREALLKEFGDGTTCPCVFCGIRVGEGSMEQDKIKTTAEGGRYRLNNLVPSCSSCNKVRGDTPWSKIKWPKS